MFKFKKPAKGFTLIEILIVIGIIAILAAVVIIAINPAKQFADARNSQRVANVNAILNAIGQRTADNKGIFDGEFQVGGGGTTYDCGALPTTETNIRTDNDDDAGELGCLVPTYIPALPSDPADSNTADTDTEYTVQVLANGRLQVCAPESANETATTDDTEICVTR